MRYALFLGCKTPYFVPAYETATRRVLAALEVELVEPEFNCCGYPLASLHFDSYLLAAARNLAIAEAQGLDMLTPCKCCFGAFKRAMRLFQENPAQLATVNAALAEEGLRYAGRAQVKHLLQVLHDDLGNKVLQQHVTRPYQNLKVAVMYGCHALRPSKVTGFDHPYAPTLIDRLVEMSGGQPVDWEGRLGCCGSPVREANPELSLGAITARLREARQGGADVLLVNCPYSQIQAEWAYREAGPVQAEELVAGTALYPQLLGLTMGLTPTELGLELSNSNAIFLTEFLPREA
jgi:heterodisulfide reductase subunit B